MTDIHVYQPIRAEGIAGGAVSDDDPHSAGVVLDLSMEPPEEWTELLNDEVPGPKSEFPLRQVRVKGAELHFWTNTDRVDDAIDVALDAIEATNEKFEERYSEILEAQRMVNEQIEAKRSDVWTR